MITPPKQITLLEWQDRYRELCKNGLNERFYGGPLCRHAKDGDTRLEGLKLDNSAAALALWNLILSENDRLHKAKAQGKQIIGAMKDLGTVPVMAYAFDNVTAFYPDGTWWTPCFMEQREGLFELASQLGLDETFCPVRAMAAAFVNKEHFPMADALICSTGAVCDDFSAIAQRIEQLGFKIHWWQMPHRREPMASEESVELPGGLKAPRCQVDFVRGELEQVKIVLEQTAGNKLTEGALRQSIVKANQFRAMLNELRILAYTTEPCPMGALEMLAAEMLVLHYCSAYDEAVLVLRGLLEEVRTRVRLKTGVLQSQAAKIFWVNPTADLAVMNLLEECGGRVCGTEYLFSHTLDLIREDLEPMEALARTALADPMAGSTHGRADRICQEITTFGAEGVVISRIPGASHCCFEGKIIGTLVKERLALPVIEIEVPTLCDAADSNIRTRLEALVETIRHRRVKC